MSSSKSQVYFNKFENKLVVNFTGTRTKNTKEFLNDFGTDLYLAAGFLKNTNRYKDAHSLLRLAKNKYGVATAEVTGHSLGGTLAQYVSSKDDTVITVNAGSTFGQKGKSNQRNIRFEGDIVSFLGEGYDTYKNVNSSYNPIANVFSAHALGNAKAVLES